MIVGIKVSGFEEKEVRLSPKEERAGLLSVSNHMFNKMVEEEREKVLMRLMIYLLMARTSLLLFAIKNPERM